MPPSNVPYNSHSYGRSYECRQYPIGFIVAEFFLDEVVGEYCEEQAHPECRYNVSRFRALPFDDVDEGQCWPVEEIERVANESDPYHRRVG